MVCWSISSREQLKLAVQLATNLQLREPLIKSWYAQASIADRIGVKWNTSSGSWSVSLDTPKRHIADCRRTQIGYMRCSSAPISTCWHVQDGLSKNLRSPDKGVLCPFGPLGADYRESESRKGSGKATFAYRFVNCNEISVINQRFPKVTARKRKF